MANLDSNQWYNMYVSADQERSLWGTKLKSEDRIASAIFFNATQKEKPPNRWQIYALNASTYVFRTEAAGPNLFLSTTFAQEETIPGQTRGRMIKGSFSDDAIYWTITPWGDGTFYMTNGANGTAWHLGRKDNGLVAMDSNITAPQPGQGWSFESISPINNERYSSIDLPSATSASQPVGSPTNTGVPSTTTGVGIIGSTSPSSSGQLSTVAKAGIGIGVSLVALIAFVVLGLFVWRRRRRQALAEPYQYGHSTHELAHGSETVKYEMYFESAARYEMPGVKEPPPVELPNTGFIPSAR